LKLETCNLQLETLKSTLQRNPLVNKVSLPLNPTEKSILNGLSKDIIKMSIKNIQFHNIVELFDNYSYASNYVNVSAKSCKFFHKTT
jgi:hypothetical protein